MVDYTLNLRAGKQPTPDGQYGAVRGGNQGEVVVSEAHGFYTEPASRGDIYQLLLGATTTGVAAGNISAAAAAAVTNFAVWNPITAKKSLAILKFWIMPISGTPVGGPLFHNLFAAPPQTFLSLLTNGALTNCNPAGPVGYGRGIAVAAGSALTGGGAYTAVRPSSIGFSAGAFASVAGTYGLEIIDGDIILPPGYGWAPCWQGAGTTLLSSYGATWEEF